MLTGISAPICRINRGICWCRAESRRTRMALQLRRLLGTSRLQENIFSTSSRLPPVMYHCRTIQNLSNTCITYSPPGNSLRNAKPIQLRMTSSVDGHGQVMTFCLHAQLRVGTIISTGHEVGSTSGLYRIGNNFRFFSSKNKIKSRSRVDPKDGSDNVVVGREKVKHSLLQIFSKQQKQAKSLSSCNSIHGEIKVAETAKSGSSSVIVPAYPVSSSARKTGKANATIDTKETEKQLSLNVRKRQGAVKHNGKTQQSKANIEKNQQPSSNKLDLLPAESTSLSEVNVKGKKSARRKKTNATDRSVASKQPSSAGVSKAWKREIRPLYPPSGKSVLVVESVTKAKIIQNYLGDMFEVLPSYGHVRDLAGRSGSVRPDDNFSMVWEVPASAWTHLKSIKVALSGAENLVLASDPDREGEAIAWHIIEMLQQQDALSENINVARVVFHEITEAAVKNALKSPRNIDANLVNAYLARRALDYLIGFSISPLLWRKLPGCQSAGRVQSAALSLICDREMEIDQFKSQEYYTVEVEFGTSDSSPANSAPILSQLTYFNSQKLDQLSISTHEQTEEIKKRLSSAEFKVLALKTSKIQRNPPMPYITSTLQQDSANKLRFTAAYTMKLAQKLYEGIKLSDAQATGLITYMRTDGLHVSDEAARDIRSLVIERYGGKFAAKNIRKYFKKVKNAQESHEAIRPTSIQRLPSSLVGIIDEDCLKLYTLIWVRAMACQMESSTTNLVQVDFGNAEGDIVLHSSASRTGFLGFQAVYQDSEAALHRNVDDQGIDYEEAFRCLSALKVNDPVILVKVELEKHHTKPPARYSEGSLVKKLEELGIGRPSTYAPTIKVLQDRNYVVLKNRALFPEFRGRMVSAFLSHNFSEVADYSFTADMENELDNVSAGTTDWKGLLRDYWSRFSKLCQLASNVNIRQVEKMLEETLGHIFFASLPDKSRACPSCSEGMLVLKVSRFGAGYFIGCNQHPKCKYISGSVFSEDEESVPPEKPDMCFQPKLLGFSPDSNEKIYLKNGPYGFYVQLGEDRKGSPPKRASIEAKDVESLTVDDAMEWLRYPLTLGEHPDDQQPVVLKHSKFGFSVRHRRTIAPVPKNLDAKKITLEVGLKLLLSKNAKQCGRPKNKPKSEAEEALWL